MPLLVAFLLLEPRPALAQHSHGDGPWRRSLDGRIETLVSFAGSRSPELRAARERWRAASARTGLVGRLPDPMVDLGTFAWTSGGDVAPALSRVAIRQELPWPSERRAERDAAGAEAEALASELAATWLDLRRRVIEGAAEIWMVGQLRELEEEQLVVLQGLAEMGRGALTTGMATLADQQQLELALARLEDSIHARRERETGLRVRLRAQIGAPPDLELGPIEGPAPATLPGETLEELAHALPEHPEVVQRIAMANAAEAMARQHQALGLPGLGVAVEWMRMPDAMGPRAISPMLSVRIPLGRDRHREGAHGADAERLAWLAERDAALLQVGAELEETLARLRDAKRRVELHQSTLHPQAETAWLSVLGSYSAGRNEAAAALMALRDLFEVRMGLVEAHADHAMAWAGLEALVGRGVSPLVDPLSPVPGTQSPVPPSPPTPEPQPPNPSP